MEENTKKDIDEKELLKEIEAKRQERINRCREKIEKALEEEKCYLSAQLLITDKGNNFQIIILPRE